MLRKYVSTSLAASSLWALYKYNANHENLSNEMKSPSHPYALTPNEKDELNHLSDKPTIVSLYDEDDGAENANLAIQHFQSKGIEVVMVPSKEGLKHPIFASSNISGIFLPGGSDVPLEDNNDPRKRFEGQLVQMARKSDIPLLGICRGEQTIGYSYRSSVEDLSEYDKHYSHSYEVYEETGNPNFNNKVSVKPGSQLYRALRHTFSNEGEGNKPIEYAVTCLHHQHIKNDANHPNPEVKITACNPFDKTIEGIEIRTGKYYTVGLQHHPEVVINNATLDRKEKIEQAVEAALELSYLDSDSALFSSYKACTKIPVQSKDERAARVELGLFTHQVKKKFLDQHVKQKPESYRQNIGLEIGSVILLPRF